VAARILDVYRRLKEVEHYSLQLKRSLNDKPLATADGVFFAAPASPKHAGLANMPKHELVEQV